MVARKFPNSSPVDSLFDGDYYLSANPDVAAAGVDPYQHYLQFGWREGRNPSPFFDQAYYLAQYPDVAAAQVNPLLHFETFGAKEGRNPSPLFDTAYYLAQNPDVAAAGANPLLHFITFGWKEGRNPSPLFDTNYYLSQNPDVAAAGVNPLEHFQTFGWKEGRNPNAFFDTKYYLAHNPDVAAAGIDPLVHFAIIGWKEGRDPSSLFSVSKYLAANPDVAKAGLDPLLHYLEFGIKEGRLALPVVQPNRPPIAVNDSYDLRPNQTLTIDAASGLLINDSDPDGNSIRVSSVDVTTLQGSLIAGLDGSFTYTPTAGFAGDTSFTYSVSDGLAISRGIVTLHVINHAPVAVDDAFYTRSSLDISPTTLLANDFDPDGCPINFVGVAGAQHGTVSFNNGTIHYVASNGYSGIDSFQYRIADANGYYAYATVYVTVPANHNPIAGDDAFYTTSSLDISPTTLLANDSDLDGDSITFIGVTGAPHGTISFNNGIIHYEAANGYSGVDTFQYRIEDAYGGYAYGTVSVTVPTNPISAGDDVVALSSRSGQRLYTTLQGSGGESFLPYDRDGFVSSVLPTGTQKNYAGLVFGNGRLYGAYQSGGSNYIDQIDPDTGRAVASIRINEPGVIDNATIRGIAFDPAGFFYCLLVYPGNETNPSYIKLSTTGNFVSVGGFRDADNPVTNYNGLAFGFSARFNRTVLYTTARIDSVFCQVVIDPVTGQVLDDTRILISNGNGTSPLVGLPADHLAGLSFYDGSLYGQFDFTNPGNPDTAALFRWDPDTATGTFIKSLEYLSQSVKGVTRGLAADDTGHVVVIDAATLLANDTTTSGGTLVIDSILTQPTYGQVRLSNDKRTIIYIRNANSVEPDGFDYVVRDTSTGARKSAHVTLKTQAEVIVARDDIFSARANEQLVFSKFKLLENDTISDNGPIAFASVGAAGHGKVEFDGRSISYTPDLGFTGTDQFNYYVKDPYGYGYTAGGVVTITVQEASNALTVNENISAGIPFGYLKNFTPPGSNRTLSLVGNSNLLFKIENGFLVTRGTLDYEAKSTHDVVVRITAPDGSFADEHVLVTVTDATDTLPFGGVSNDTITGSNGTAGSNGVGSGSPGSVGGTGGSGTASGTADASLGETIWAGDAAYQNVQLVRTATVGTSGTGGNGSVGYISAYSDTSAQNGGITQTTRTYSAANAGAGGGAGAGAAGGDATVLLASQLVALGGQSTGQGDTASFAANANGGTGARGGAGGTGGNGAEAQDVTSGNTRFTTSGTGGGGGANGAAGGAGGAASAVISGMVLSSSNVQLTLTTHAIAGSGGNGGFGGAGGDGSIGGAGGNGGSGGAGGAALAAITGLNTGGQSAMSVTLNLTAEGGYGGGGGGAGSGGKGQTTTNSSISRTRAANGVAAKGGDGGAATARLADGTLVFGNSNDYLQINASVVMGGGASGGSGVASIAAVSQAGLTDTGRAATPDGARGADGAAIIEITGNQFDLGGGDDTLSFRFSETAASGSAISPGVLFQNNSFDGGEGRDRLAFETLDDLRFDTRAGTISVQGSPANAMHNFESFAGGSGTNTFVDGTGDYEYDANGLATDAFYFAPGSGNDIISGFTSGQDSLHLEGFSAFFGSDANAFLASHLSTGANGAYILDLTTPGGAASQIVLANGDRLLAADIHLM